MQRNVVHNMKPIARPEQGRPWLTINMKNLQNDLTKFQIVILDIKTMILINTINFSFFIGVATCEVNSGNQIRIVKLRTMLSYKRR